MGKFSRKQIDSILIQKQLRFIKPLLFSKFYLEIDNQTGRVGQWLGWQIVRSYMENHEDVTWNNY